MTNEYNNRGDELCVHEFNGGLCCHCLAPETSNDQIRAENALRNAEALKGHYSEVLGFTPNHEQAVFEAWRSHRRTA